MLGQFLIFSGLIQILAILRGWSWFLDTFKYGYLRDILGEPFFTWYVYASSGFAIVSGIGVLLK